jgi:hypothetical protein
MNQRDQLTEHRVDRELRFEIPDFKSLYPLWPLCCILILIQTTPAAQEKPVAYACDFQQVEPGPVPADFKVLRGEFAVKQEDGNRFLELGAGELNSFGLLLGPEQAGDASILARLRGWPTGKRMPEFGVGLGGTRGYQLWLMPAVNELQIRRDHHILARVPLGFRPGNWLQMHLDLRANGDGRWLVVGRAWWEGEPPPAKPLLQYDLTELPPAGRASLWGTPYSEKAIQFDEVVVK